jgi:hypothetical protein
MPSKTSQIKNNPVVRIKDIQMVPISKLIRNPKNPNVHSPKQIKRIAEIIEFQGWRRPITVSNRSGFISVGHGRLSAAELRGWTEVPVTYQDYESEAAEYADMVADNAIASWSELNIDAINSEIPALGVDFNPELLAIKDLKPVDIDFDKDEFIPVDIPVEYQVLISCNSEDDQKDIYQELEARGLKIKLI